VSRKNIVGIRIKAARKEARMSQMKLAAEMQLQGIKIDRSTVAKLESGRRPISDVEIIAIAKIFNVPVQVLFEGSSEISITYLFNDNEIGGTITANLFLSTKANNSSISCLF
jgi:transcriptional regulator with XRE-family HTH domain